MIPPNPFLSSVGVQATVPLPILWEVEVWLGGTSVLNRILSIVY